MEHEPLERLYLQSLARTVDHWLLREPIRPDGVGHRDELFELDAPYQRGAVWTPDQRVGLIKSLLMGLPTGAIVTSQMPYTTPGPSYRVVDGKQRILAVRAFVAGDVWVPGWWFRQEDLGPLRSDELVTWDHLTDQGRRLFTNRSLPELMYVGDREHRTPKALLRAEAELYLLLNGAGTPHTQDDLDRAAGLL